jgi:hypothetical protein
MENTGTSLRQRKASRPKAFWLRFASSSTFENTQVCFYSCFSLLRMLYPLQIVCDTLDCFFWIVAACCELAVVRHCGATLHDPIPLFSCRVYAFPFEFVAPPCLSSSLLYVADYIIHFLMTMAYMALIGAWSCLFLLGHLRNAYLLRQHYPFLLRVKLPSCRTAIVVTRCLRRPVL